MPADGLGGVRALSARRGDVRCVAPGTSSALSHTHDYPSVRDRRVWRSGAKEPGVSTPPLDEPPDPLQRPLDVLVAAGIAGTDVAFSPGPECVARDHRHPLLR